MNGQDAGPDEPRATATGNVHVVKGRLFRRRQGHGWAFSVDPVPPPPEPVRRPARVAQMLAFAHSVRAGIDRGEYGDQADAARRLGLTRARVTQLLNLALLAPEIQEAVLFLEAVDGVEPLSERAMRDLGREADWQDQRVAWENRVDRIRL